jgi:two-component system sensor histidine kinase ChiS
LILIVTGIFIGGCFGNFGSSGKIPKAQNGVLDLRGWNFERQGSLPLDGEWQFYWKQLLTPADFAVSGAGSQAPRLTGMIRVSGAWLGYPLKNRKLSSSGFATYRLQLLVPDRCRLLGLDLP